MIPFLAGIRRAIYNLNKRVDLLNELIKDILGLDSSSIQSLINILNDKNASTGILNTLLLKADKSEIPAAQILSDWNLLDDTKLDYIKNKPITTNGADGLSAYQIAVNNGFVGDEVAWLASLHGQDGNDGNDGNDGITPHIDPTTGNWFIGDTDTNVKAQGPAGNDGQNGTNGVDGQDGQDGKSAFELAQDNGFVGTVSEWLASLHGQDGADGQDGQDGQNGANGVTPHIDPTTGNWFIGETNTRVKASFSSESAVSGGNTLSVVTTGEKYNWDNKANIWRGTLAEYDLILTPDNNTIYIITPDLP